MPWHATEDNQYGQCGVYWDASPPAPESIRLPNKITGRDNPKCKMTSGGTTETDKTNVDNPGEPEQTESFY